MDRDRAPRSLTAAALVALALLAPAVLGACATDGDSDERADAGAEASTDAAGAVDGAAVYADACAECHGSDLRGTGKGPSHLSEVYEPGHHPDAAFRSAIERGSPAHHWGFGDMPPVEGLSDAEIDAVIAFIRAEQQAQGFEPYPPPG